MLPCRGSLRVVRASRVCGARWSLLLGTCPCALVVARGLPLWRALWPRVVRRASSVLVALGAPVSFADAVLSFPTPGLARPDLLGGCAGHVEAGREPGSLCLPLAPVEVWTLGWHRVVPVRGPAMGLSLAGPSSVSLGLRALRWVGVCRPGHSRVRFPVPSVFRRGPRLVHRGCFVWTLTPPLFWLGDATPRVPCVCACGCFSCPGWAGWPARRVLVHLGFPSAVLSSCFAGLLRAGVALFLSIYLRWFFPSSCSFCAPAVSGFFWFPAPAVLGLGAVWFSPPPPAPLIFFRRGFRLGPPSTWRAVCFALFCLVCFPPRPLSLPLLLVLLLCCPLRFLSLFLFFFLRAPLF